MNENYEYLGGSGGGGSGSGTVTSVGLQLPSLFVVSGSPVTTSGTLMAALATQPANTFFAGPVSGANATPTFRTQVLADLAPLTVGTTAGQALVSTGSGTTPMFATVSGGGSGMFQQVFTGAGQTHTATTAESGTRYILTGAASSALNLTLPSDSAAASPYKWSVFNLSGTDGAASGGSYTVSIPAGYTVQYAGASYTSNLVSTEKGAAMTFENLVGTAIFMITSSSGTWTGT